MQKIETLAIETYQKNLDYFDKNVPHVFKKIQALEYAINSGQYSAKYDLEYLAGYFDVKELKSGNYLYAKDSNTVSEELTQAVNYSKNSNIFEGFPLYYNQEKNENLDDKGKGIEGIYPIMTYYIDNTTDKDELKAINKFIFIGVGLGGHLINIHNKINALSYLIVEDDLELFNLSLFCTPYYELAKETTLYYSVSDNTSEFSNTANTYLNANFLNNRFIKYSHFSAHSSEKIKLIQNVITSQDFFTFPYKTRLNKYLRPLESIKNSYSIVDFSKRFNNSIFSEKPVIALASGPSLQKNIKWLAENQEHFIIIAVASSLKTLYHNKITPDLVTHLDGFDISLSQFEGFPVEKFLENTMFLFGSFTPREIIKKFKKENCFLTEEDGTYYNSDYNSIAGPCIGSTSIYHSIILDTNELYILGTDFSIDEESGLTHSQGHITTTKLDIAKNSKTQNKLSFRENLFQIKGNFRDTVYTLPLFHVSLQDLYNKLPLMKKEYQNIYNLSDGAYMDSTIPKHIKDINVESFERIDKTKVRKMIASTLKSQSSTGLSDEDLRSMHLRLQKTKEIKKEIDRYRNTMSFTNSNKYQYDLLDLVDKILQKANSRESRNLVSIYDAYFQYALPIIMDFFNTKGIKNEKKHIQKFNEMMQNEIFDIENIYQKAIEKFLEE